MKKTIDESGLQIIALIPEVLDTKSLEITGRPVTELPRNPPFD